MATDLQSQSFLTHDFLLTSKEKLYAQVELYSKYVAVSVSYFYVIISIVICHTCLSIFPVSAFTLFCPSFLQGSDGLPGLRGVQGDSVRIYSIFSALSWEYFVLECFMSHYLHLRTCFSNRSMYTANYVSVVFIWWCG